MLLMIVARMIAMLVLLIGTDENIYQRQLDQLPDVDIMNLSVFNDELAESQEFFTKYIKPSRDFYTRRLIDTSKLNYRFVISMSYKTYDQKRRKKYEDQGQLKEILKKAAIEGKWERYFYHSDEEVKEACDNIFSGAANLESREVQEVNYNKRKLFIQIRDDSFVVTNHREVFDLPRRSESKTEWPSDSYYKSPELRTIFDSEDYYYINYRASAKNMLAYYQGAYKQNPERLDEIFKMNIAKKQIAEIVKERIVDDGEEATRIYLFEEQASTDSAYEMEYARLFEVHNDSDFYNLIPKDKKKLLREPGKVTSIFVMTEKAAENSLNGFIARMEMIKKAQERQKSKKK